MCASFAVGGSAVVTHGDGPVGNLGFEFGEQDVRATPAGWTFHGSGEQGGVFSDIVSPDSNYGSEQSFGSPTPTHPVTGANMGYWAIRKTYRVSAAGETLSISAIARVNGTIPSGLTYTEGSETFVGEDDAFIEVRCYQADGSLAGLTAAEQHSETALTQLFDRTGRTGAIEDEWQPLTHSVALPSGTEYVEVELVATDGNDGVHPLGYRGANAGVLFDDVRPEYPTGLVEAPAVSGGSVTHADSATTATNLDGGASEWKTQNSMVVNGSHADFATAQAAVDFAEANGYKRVVFGGGMYGPITVDALDMHIEGESRAVVFESNNSVAISMNGDWGTVENVEARTQNTSIARNGIVAAGANCTVRDCQVQQVTGNGIHSSGTNGLITGCRADSSTAFNDVNLAGSGVVATGNYGTTVVDASGNNAIGTNS